MATHSNTLAWKIPWMEKPDRLQSMVLQRVVSNSYKIKLLAYKENSKQCLAWLLKGQKEKKRHGVT